MLSAERGLARNPAVPAALLRRLVTGADSLVLSALTRREDWTDEQFEVLATHPEVEVPVSPATRPRSSAPWSRRTQRPRRRPSYG